MLSEYKLKYDNYYDLLGVFKKKYWGLLVKKVAFYSLAFQLPQKNKDANCLHL
jgi:hypothetical protein